MAVRLKKMVETAHNEQSQCVRAAVVNEVKNEAKWNRNHRISTFFSSLTTVTLVEHYLRTDAILSLTLVSDEDDGTIVETLSIVSLWSIDFYPPTVNSIWWISTTYWRCREREFHHNILLKVSPLIIYLLFFSRFQPICSFVQTSIPHVTNQRKRWDIE